MELFKAIVAAQGAWRSPARPGVFMRDVLAPKSGRIERLDGYAIAGLARAAGAPIDKSAGVDILVDLGAEVRQGQPVLRLHAAHQAALDRAVEEQAPDEAVAVA